MNFAIMSGQVLDANNRKDETYEKLIEGDKDIEAGRFSDGDEVMQKLKKKYINFASNIKNE